MNEPTPASHGASASQPLNYTTPAHKPMNMTSLGGGFGIAGASIGLLFFVAACAGYDAGFHLSFIPIGLGILGLILAVIGTILDKSSALHTSQGLAAMWVCFIAIAGGLLEMGAWLHWTMLWGVAK